QGRSRRAGQVHQRQGVVPRGQAAVLQLLGRLPMRLALGVVLGAACAIAIACGAAQRSPRSSASSPGPQEPLAPPSAHACEPNAPRSPAAAPEPKARPCDPHAEFDALDQSIREELARGQIAPPAVASCTGPTCATALGEPFSTPSTADPACHPAPSA